MEPKLTDNDKIVLWGLSEYPDLKDAELSRKLGVERRTLTAVKTKLKNDSVFSTLLFPNFRELGCEILTVCYGSFNPLTGFEERAEGILKVRECEEIVYACATDKNYLLICISRNFTEFRKKACEILRLYKQKNLLKDVNFGYFPLEISRGCFFGFSGLIKKIYGLNVECEKPEFRKKEKKEEGRKKLTNKEKKVLVALVNMPEATDSEISKKTKITPYTIGLIKRKSFNKGTIKTRKIPDMDILGCELLALMHIKYKFNKKNEYENQPEEIFKISNEAESASISLFKNYTDYEEYYNRKLKHLKENELIDEDPAVLIFPTKKLNKVKEYSFTPLMKKILETDSPKKPKGVLL